MLRNFFLFPQLPIELQDMIWQISLSESRVISGDDCFREWWYRKHINFLSPVALYVCHHSRSLAEKVLSRTSICIPGVPGWKTLYICQKYDYLHVTAWNVQMNMQISRFIADPALVNRLVISGITAHTEWLKKDTMRYFDQFTNLEEVVLTDQGRLYQIQNQALLTVNYWTTSVTMSELVQRVQKFFGEKEKKVQVSGYQFRRN